VSAPLELSAPSDRPAFDGRGATGTAGAGRERGSGFSMSDQQEPASLSQTVTSILNVVARKSMPVVLVIILGYLVWLARDALAPYLGGLLIIYILLPLVHRIERMIPDKGILVNLERPVAAFLSLGLAALIAAVVAIILIDPLIQQTTALVTELTAYLQEGSPERAGFQRFYQERIPPQVREWLENNIEQVGQQVVSGSMGAATWFLNFTGSIVSSVFALVAVPLFIIFYLIDEKSTAAALRKQLPLIWAEDIVAFFRIADRILGSYTRAVVVQVAIIAAATAAGYSIVGIEMALPLGIIAGAGAIVPIVGLWVSLIVTVPVVIATQAEHLIPAIIVYFGVQLISGWVLMPKIQGTSVDFTTTGVLLIIAIAGAIAGPLGLIFALPVAAVIRAVVVYTYYRLRGDSPETAIRSLRLFQTDADLKSPSILQSEKIAPPVPAMPTTSDAD
jgi:predicted PurR-regulated permease PerM